VYIRIDEALTLCPHLIAVQARPRLYVEYHHRIAAAIERCIPIQQVMSCDEFACQLMGTECKLERAVDIAYAIKSELRTVDPAYAFGHLRDPHASGHRP
jgi:DNA polymerase-4